MMNVIRRRHKSIKGCKGERLCLYRPLYLCFSVSVVILVQVICGIISGELQKETACCLSTGVVEPTAFTSGIVRSSGLWTNKRRFVVGKSNNILCPYHFLTQ